MCRIRGSCGSGNRQQWLAFDPFRERFLGRAKRALRLPALNTLKKGAYGAFFAFRVPTFIAPRLRAHDSFVLRIAVQSAALGDGLASSEMGRFTEDLHLKY
jgi:hypothetical protein